MTDSVKEQVGDLVSRAKRRVGVEQPSAADDDGRVGVVRGALYVFPRTRIVERAIGKLLAEKRPPTADEQAVGGLAGRE